MDRKYADDRRTWRRDFVCVGSAPPDEPYVKAGEPDYSTRMRAECDRFIEWLRGFAGPEPPGAKLEIKWFRHELGPYCEVVCHFDPVDEESCQYALLLEGYKPKTWEYTGEDQSDAMEKWKEAMQSRSKRRVAE